MTYFDAHCHIFNGSILKDIFPTVASSGKFGATGKPQVVGSVFGDFWKWITQTVDAMVYSEAQNHKFLVKTLKKKMPGADAYATVPLMMDLKYLFGSDLQAGQKIPTGPLVLDSGMTDQITALQALSAAGNCYPFIAVDPRRPGMVEAILDGQFVTRKPGGFYGVKLYPRLGYHPMSGRLPELYAYCAANNIPIMSHCAVGGFPPWNTSASDFGHPDNYGPALAANPALRIDLAHWGNGNFQWAGRILNLMRTYPGVYSDLSCYTGSSDIVSWKIPCWGYPLARERTMYGSDYDLFYLTKADMDMGDYIQSFKDNFTDDELKAMMGTLPQKFLGI